MRSHFVFSLCLSLIGACASSHGIDAVRPGMTRAELIASLGDPESVSREGSNEALGFFVCRSNCAAKGIENRHGNRYIIKLVDGRVDSIRAN